MPEYFTLTYKEIGPVSTQDTLQTDRLLIIGTALDGPNNSPRKVNTQQEAETIFGPLVYATPFVNPNTGLSDNAYAHNELVRAYVEAVRAGAEDIWLCRIGGTKAGILSLGGSAGYNVTARSAGRLYNGIVVTATSGATSGTLTLANPAALGGSLTYNISSGTTLVQLVNTVNSDSRNRALTLSLTSAADAFALARTIMGSGTTSSGTYGTAASSEDYNSNKYGLYTELTREDGTFDSVDLEADLVLLAGIYLDDQVVSGSAATTTSVGADFAEYIYNLNQHHPTHGFIGLRPLGMDDTNPEAIIAHIRNYWEDTSAGYVSSTLKWLKAGYFMSAGFTGVGSQGETLDYGSYISVVAGPDVRMGHPTLGNYQTSPVATYAGFVSQLDSHRATTKKQIPGTLGLAYAIREKQIVRLVNGIGFNSITRSNGRGAVVVFRRNTETMLPEIAYDVTFAYDRSLAHADLQAQRVANEAVRLIKRELDPFIGEGINTQNMMAMESRVRRVLERMVELGKLHQSGEGDAFAFTITATPNQIANNEVSVDLVLRPALQAKRIRINTTVRRG